MRAHFASDIPASPDADAALQEDSSSVTLMTKEPQPNSTSSETTQHLLHDRIVEFKSDSSKMAVVGEFIDDVLQKAEEEANKQQNDKNQNSQQVSKNISLILASTKVDYDFPSYSFPRVKLKHKNRVSFFLLAIFTKTILLKFLFSMEI